MLLFRKITNLFGTKLKKIKIKKKFNIYRKTQTYENNRIYKKRDW